MDAQQRVPTEGATWEGDGDRRRELMDAQQRVPTEGAT
jgi:hypothetical protein